MQNAMPPGQLADFALPRSPLPADTEAGIGLHTEIKFPDLEMIVCLSLDADANPEHHQIPLPLSPPPIEVTHDDIEKPDLMDMEFLSEDDTVSCLTSQPLGTCEASRLLSHHPS